MDGSWWILPVLGCGLMMVMMVVMMLGMGKSILSRNRGEDLSVEELRAEQRRLAERIERLDGQHGEDREGEPTRGAV